MARPTIEQSKLGYAVSPSSEEVTASGLTPQEGDRLVAVCATGGSVGQNAHLDVSGGGASSWTKIVDVTQSFNASCRVSIWLSSTVTSTPGFPVNVTLDVDGRSQDNYIDVHVVRPPTSGHTIVLIDSDENAGTDSGSSVTIDAVDDSLALDGLIAENEDIQPGSGLQTEITNVTGAGSRFGTSSRDSDSPDVTMTWTTLNGLPSPNAIIAHGGITLAEDDTSPPDAPTGLTATADGFDAIDLSWTAPSAGGGTISGYQIQRRSPGGSGPWSVLVEDTESTSTTYTDGELSPDTNYEYRVAAWNEHGLGDFSDPDDATTGSAPSNGARRRVVITET